MASRFILSLVLVFLATVHLADSPHVHRDANFQLEHFHAKKLRMPIDERGDLESRAVFTGFQLAEKQSLAGLGLSTACEQALYQPLKCDNFTATLGDSSYHGSIADPAMAASVCDTTCSTALANLRGSIATAYATSPTLFPGFPTLALIDSIRGGWNETCLKDTASGAYCNDIIASWAEVDEVSSMPTSQLCSFCYGAKLSTMRQNPYGAYDSSDYKVRYDYVIKNCGLPARDTNPSTGGIKLIGDTFQCPGKTYVVKSGDTCDSIAKSNLVSSGSLYEINPLLLNCSNPSVGLNICLPPQCEKLYTVQPTDTCNTIGFGSGISWLSVISFNGMIDQWCSNLWNSIPNWGRTLCVSPPGGTFISIPTNTSGGDLGGQGGTGDGYALSLVSLPAGAVLATGTTAKCGKFYTAKTGDSCASIFTLANTPSDLFIAANPSLVSALKCSSNVVPGRTYCVHPVRGWDETSSSTTTSSQSTTTSEPTSTTSSKPTTTTTATGNGIATPTPIQTGMVKTCNTFYKVQSGDQCGTLAAAKGISLANFYSWNPAVGSTCQSLQIGVYVCINVIGGNPISTNGRCGAAYSNATCAGSTFGNCCSIRSNCGSTQDFCGTAVGCQAAYGTCAPISTDGKCGAASSTRATCTGSSFGKCCSVKGNCGDSAAFCAVDNLCQPMFGACSLISIDGKCGAASSTGATCLGSTFGNCCSVKGNCGSSDAFCASNNLCQPNFGTCYPKTTDGKCGSASSTSASCSGSTFGNCCSVKRNCGSTAAFCAVANLCQPTFGTCT